MDGWFEEMTLTNSTKCHYPDFDNIVKTCKELMDEKFRLYGNSWENTKNEVWWMKRLTGEITELFLTKGKTEARKELLDIINIASMMYDNLTRETNRG